MTGRTTGASFGKSGKELWHALFLIIPVTLGWIWFLITNANLPKEKKPNFSGT
jgi:hypothetical protein